MAVDEGYQAVAQAYINDGIADNTFYRDAKLNFLANLAGENGKPTNQEIGRPSGQYIFAGTTLTKARRMELSGVNSFKPRFRIANPTAAAYLGGRDTAVQLSSPSSAGGSQDQISGTAQVNWTGLLQEEIIIWDETMRRALADAGADKKGRGIARAQVIREGVQTATQNVYTKLATSLQSGAPTDQDADPMDDLIGWATWFSKTNVCARVDRSVVKNAQWRAQVDSTARAPVASDLIDLANITYGLDDLSQDGARALFVNNAQFVAMKAECLGKGFVEMSTDMPSMAKYGAKNRFVLQKDNVYIVRDRQVPASTCYAIVPNTWLFITHPDDTFKVGQFVHDATYNRGGLMARRALVSLRAMLVCLNPGLNVVFNNISDPS